MIINASSTQDRVARDGTTTTVVICAEMLRNAWLVRQGVHPSIIARGFAQAEAFALSSLDELSIDATPQQIESAIETSLAGKLDKGMEKHLANLSLEAGQVILSDGRADPTRVKIIKQTGGTFARFHHNYWTGTSKPIHPNERARWSGFNFDSRWWS